METKQEVIEEKKVQGFSWNAEEQKYIYTNVVGIYSSIYDFTFILGLKGENQSAFRHCDVHMSPQHAKAVFKLLGTKIEEYEEKFGYIPEQPTETDHK